MWLHCPLSGESGQAGASSRGSELPLRPQWQEPWGLPPSPSLRHLVGRGADSHSSQAAPRGALVGAQVRVASLGWQPAPLCVTPSKPRLCRTPGLAGAPAPGQPKAAKPCTERPGAPAAGCGPGSARPRPSSGRGQLHCGQGHRCARGSGTLPAGLALALSLLWGLKFGTTLAQWQEFVNQRELPLQQLTFLTVP